MENVFNAVARGEAAQNVLDRDARPGDRARSLGLNYVGAADAAVNLTLDDICAALRFDPPRQSKSPRQRKKWRQPKETALSAFVELVGNRPITSLTRADALRLRSHWQDRVVAGEVQIGTANECIGHVGTMFRAINESKQLNLPSIFERVRIRGGKDNQRVAFAPAFVQERILAEGMFDDLNPEARRAIYLIVETGLRLSEAINLSRETIRLSGWSELRFEHL